MPIACSVTPSPRQRRDFSALPLPRSPENVSLRASSSRSEANAKTDFDLPVASWFFLG